MDDNKIAFDIDGRKFISTIEKEMMIAGNRCEVWHTYELVGDDVEAFGLDIIQKDTPDDVKLTRIAKAVEYHIDHGDDLAA
jgi:hypothetical protein